MLVLSRKVGEWIVIADNIRVCIHSVHGTRVVLGFEAPSDVRVRRAELAPLPAETTPEPGSSCLQSPVPIAP